MVIGGYSCLRCRGFESQHQVLDGHFFQQFVVTNYFLFEIPKITKRGRGWTIKKNSHMACNNQSESFILDYRSYASVIATRPSPPPPCPRLGRTSRQRITCTCTYELQRHFWFRIRRSTSKIESF